MNMKTRGINFLWLTLVSIALMGTAVSAQVRVYTVSDWQVQTLLNRIESRTNSFKMALGRALDNSVYNGTNREDSINTLVNRFETATDRLKSNFASRRSTAADVQEVMSTGAMVNRFMLNNQMSSNAESLWTQIRTDLNTLAGYYNVTANWDSSSPVFGGGQVIVNDAQVRAIIARAERRTRDFDRSFDRWYVRTYRASTENNPLDDDITTLSDGLRSLRTELARRTSDAADIETVLRPGSQINAYVTTNQVNRDVLNKWNLLRQDLQSLASEYRVSWNWNETNTLPTGGGVIYTGTDADVRALITRIQNRSRTFHQAFDNWSERRTGVDHAVDPDPALEEMNTALESLRLGFNNRRSTVENVQAVLRPAATINTFLANNRASYQVMNEWNSLRSDLDTLANYYRVSWNWNQPGVPAGGVITSGDFDTALTGTYRLNSSLSDNLATVIDRAIITVNYNTAERDRVRRVLERRLASPEMLSFEKRGDMVTMTSPNGQTVTLDADNVARTETSPNGRSVTTRVSATNGALTIDYSGDRMNDYFVTFTPAANGQLRVSRRIYLENQNQTVTAVSVYDKVNQSPNWNMTAGNVNTGPVTSGGFIIPNNTAIIATLDTPLSSKTARDGDRFSMTVTSPGQYSGAVIEGVVSGQQSGVFTGRANLNMNFQTIRMRDGRTYTFAGIVDQVRAANGDTVSVNNEGVIRDSSQTNKTVTRAGIGAVLGAIIGAIAGGGSGAAIGAGVGAGAGAGTVILQGRDNLELAAGSEFRITATAPANVGVQ